MNKYIVWLCLVFFMLCIGIMFRFLSPLACMFVKNQPYLTTVKRLGKKKVLLNRDRLVSYLTWFDTMDNATDEYWYGMYGNTKDKTQEEYDSSVILRWWYRVLWLQRNSAYTFIYKFVSINKDSKLAWQYENYKQFSTNYRWNINIGWKAHKGFEKLSFAGRFFGIKRV